MIFHRIDHRSDEWFEKRLGRPTASQFSRLITPAGKLSSQANLYESELIAERIFGRRMSKDISGVPAVRHGTETEPEAADFLQDMLGVPLASGGFMTDDNGRYGASPDRIITDGNKRELVEIKCPYEIPRHVYNLLYGPDDSHRAQIQGQLLISGYTGCHFLSYRPDCPPKHVLVERDEPFIRALAAILDMFCERLEVNYQRALGMGAWDV